MLVLATFMAICIVAVLFLLQFLLALDSESKLARNHSTVRVEPISSYRSQQGWQVRDSTPVLTLVHSGSSGQIVYPRPAYSDAFVAREKKNTQFKEA
jgi:hypothetical protein